MLEVEKQYDDMINEMSVLQDSLKIRSKAIKEAKA